MARTRPWLIASAVAICWSMLTMVLLHLVSSRNPVLDTLSSYAVSDQAPGLLATGMVSVAAGSLAILGALGAAQVPLTPTIRILFGSWSGGLTLAAAFPASFAEFPNPVSGEIHQYSSLIAFLSVPAIGFSLLDRLRAVPTLAGNRATLARWTRYSAASLLLFGASYLVAKFPGTPVVAHLSAVIPVGLTQRIALVVDVGLLCAILVLAARAAASPGRKIIATA